MAIVKDSGEIQFEFPITEDQMLEMFESLGTDFDPARFKDEAEEAMKTEESLGENITCSYHPLVISLGDCNAEIGIELEKKRGLRFKVHLKVNSESI